MKRKTVLVTGSTGFLGSHLAAALKERSSDYRIILTSGHARDAKKSSKLDLTDYAAVSQFITTIKPDIVYHLGGLVDLTRTYEVARKCIDYNLIGTTHILEALRQDPPEVFVYTSTEEVYGTDVLPYRETENTRPPSPYAVTKLASEQMCRIYSQQWNIPTIVFRIGTMYGPMQPVHRYIAQTILKALNNEPIPLNSGFKKRDYIYVQDVVRALILTLDKRILSGFEIINLGGGVNMTLTQLVEKIVLYSNSSSSLQTGVIPDRISEANEWLLDIGKAKSLLGWEPSTDIETGLHLTIDYYKQKQ